MKRIFCVLMLFLLAALTGVVWAAEWTYPGNMGLNGNNDLIPDVPSGNKVTINYAAGEAKDPRSVYGASSNAAEVKDNTVNLLQGFLLGDIHGGYEYANPGNNASGNSVVIGGENTEVSGTAYGGYSYYGSSFGNMATLNGDAKVNYIMGGRSISDAAENNSVSILGGTVKLEVYGGETYWGSGRVYGNSIVMSGGRVVGNFEGDLSSGGLWGGFSGAGIAASNTVTFNGGVTNVIYGGNSEMAEALSNEVYITGGEIKRNVYGGRGGLLTSGNTVTISGGKMDGANVPNNQELDIFAGLSIFGDSTNNSLTIKTGAVFTGRVRVYGGWTNNGRALRNTVNLVGAPDFGTSVEFECGNSPSGNTLNLVRFTGDSDGTAIKSIKGFENINFFLTEENLDTNAPVLRVTDQIDLTGISIDIAGVDSAMTGSLTSDAIITLLSSDGGIVGSPTIGGTPLGAQNMTHSGVEWEFERTSNTLTAKLVAGADVNTITSHAEVTNISGVPDTAVVGIDHTLVGTVEPSHATNQTITWSLVNPALTGATNSGENGEILRAEKLGTVIARATIEHGTAPGVHYTQDFTITIKGPGAPENPDKPNDPGDGEPVVPNEPADDEPVVPNEPNDPNVPDEEIITGDGGGSIGCNAGVSGICGASLLCGALALKRPQKRG